MTILRKVLHGLALLAIASVAHSQPAPWPNRPIRIIVAYPAGQGTDIATRYLADELAKSLGQPIIVENHAGAGGNVGTEAAARATPDGYTLTMGTNATHVLNAYLYSTMHYEAEKDFEPVSLIGTFPMVLAVKNSSKFQSVADVIASARIDPRSTDIAVPSTTARLVAELMNASSNVGLYIVPYKGSNPALTDVLGDRVPLVVDTPTALRGQISSGAVRPIAVTSLKQSGLLPNVKPVAEQGLPGFEVLAWNALYAPRGTPPAVIKVLSTSIMKIVARPDVRARLLELGFDPAGGTPVELAEFARLERVKWAPIIKAAGLKAD
ncbi:tripartite tricarboxylate transporter substrate binding protein [soil metagenome]